MLGKTGEAKTETKGAAVQEARDLWKANKKANKYIGETATESLEALLTSLGPSGQKLLTAEEIEEINETGKIKIGSRTIVFGPTIEDAYDNGDIKIGDKLTYSANGQEDWIVFGKDSKGNVLLTTSEPVGSFTPEWKKEHWFTWKDELDGACADYAGEIQEREIKARSIRIEDINRVTGFTEPKFKTYTFGTMQDYANGKVNYYYPDENSKTFVKATVDTTSIEEGSTDVPAKKIESNAYYYQKNGEEYELYCNSDGSYTTTIDLTKNLKNVSNMKYVIGESSSYMQYYVASCAVDVMRPNDAAFRIFSVNDGRVGMYDEVLAVTINSGAYDGYGHGAGAVRPIVELPSDILVKTTTTGTIDIMD